MAAIAAGRGLPAAALSVKPLAGLSQTLARIAEELHRRRELARSRALLAELDERMLRDIGVDRASASAEAGRGFWG